MGALKEKDPNSVLFKDKENQLRTFVDTDKIVGLRLDGRAFHTFTRGFEKPYDLNLMNAMDEATRTVMKKAFGKVLFGYTQSDEISIFLPAKGSLDVMDFKGSIQKMVSISASTATVGFLKGLGNEGINTEDLYPTFDSRVFLLDNADELQKYMDWRRLDARKNAFTMAAEAVATKKELHKLNTPGRIELLKGTKFEHLPEGFVNGRLTLSENYLTDTTYVDRRTGETVTVEGVTRTRMVTTPAYRDLVEQTINGLNI